jgi:hypothetical protein
MNLTNEQNKGLFSGVFLGYFVLLLHILLILGLGFAVVFIKGVYDFRYLILLLGLVVVGGSAYLFFRRFNENKRKLADLMTDPAFQGRTLEISLLGGMASVKLGDSNQQPQLIDIGEGREIKQLEAPRTPQVEELNQLVKMLEDDLITKEEFLQLKQKIVSP